MDIELEAEQDAAGAITAQGGETTAHSITTDVPPRVKTAAERVAEAFSSLRAPESTTLPSNFEIIQELAIGLKQQARKRSYWIMLLAFLIMAIGISCFIILSYVSDNVAITAICIICGVFSMMASFVVFFSAIIDRGIHSRLPARVAQGPIRYVMRIEGDQWKRFLTYFYSTDGGPSGFHGWWNCCGRGRQHYQRLLMRGHGHIVLGSLGFMIDELFCTTYAYHVVLNLEFLWVKSVPNEPIADLVMRVWLCRSVYNRRWGPPTPFKVDIFLASQIPSHEIPSIAKYVAIR
jgi:hypothetical protein